MKEKLDSGILCTTYMSTNAQVANVLTKSVDNPIFQTLIGKVEIGNIYSPT